MSVQRSIISTGAFAEQFRAQTHLLRTDAGAAKVKIADLRRARKRLQDADQSVLALVERDGVLFWEEPGRVLPGASGVLSAGARRVRAFRRAGDADDSSPPSGAIVDTMSFDLLPPNKIIGYLQSADAALTPNVGLFRLENFKQSPQAATWTKIAAPKPDAKTLLLIHGTFSSLENYRAEFADADGDAWRQFLKWAGTQYDQVLGFGHPTLSVSPVLNAIELERLMRGVTADVDVISHSRGGLVARWWLDGLGAGSTGNRRCVLVGSPMSGTSLASPARIRAVMSLLTNIARGIQVAGELSSAAMPFMSVAAVLGRVLKSVTGTLASTPLADAAIAMVPGLHGQSRVGNNLEIRLLRDAPSKAAYYAITSNFEPTSPGWKFWRYFRKDSILNAGADIVFGDEPGIDGKPVGVQNDLVVDTSSMTQLGLGTSGLKDILDFQTNPAVYHTNYFRQAQTFAKIQEWFGGGKAASVGVSGGGGTVTTASSTGPRASRGIARKRAKTARGPAPSRSKKTAGRARRGRG